MAKSAPNGWESTVEKGEVARYEQFLPFSLCFQKDLYCRHVKIHVFLWKKVKLLSANAFNLASSKMSFGKGIGQDKEVHTAVYGCVWAAYLI